MRYCFAFLLCLSLSAQTPPSRPKLFGVAHYSIFVSDLAKARAFYEDFLGYEEAFTLPKSDGTVQLVFVKINDHQYLELVNQPNKGEGQLNHLGLFTDDVEQMRQYLSSRGVKVPDQVVQNRIGNKKISVVDPDGNAVAVTTTLNDSFGSHVTAEGLGFLLNNEMDDFAVKQGVPNMYGLIQGPANAVGANKRPLSAMTPTIVRAAR